jgi:hypothetical protein
MGALTWSSTQQRSTAAKLSPKWIKMAGNDVLKLSDCHDMS